MVNEFKGFTGIQMIDAGAAEAVPASKPVSAFPTIAPVAEPILQPTEPARGRAPARAAAAPTRSSSSAPARPA